MLSSFNVDESTAVSVTSVFIILFMLQVSWNIVWWWTSTQATQGESFVVFITQAGLFIGCQASPSGSGTLCQLAQRLTEVPLALFQLPPWDKSTRLDLLPCSARISSPPCHSSWSLVPSQVREMSRSQSERFVSSSFEVSSVLLPFYQEEWKAEEESLPGSSLSALSSPGPRLTWLQFGQLNLRLPHCLEEAVGGERFLAPGFRVCWDCLLCIIVLLMWRVGDLLLRGECSPLFQSRRNKLQFWRQLLVVLRQPLLPFIWEMSPTGIWIPYP